jgi:hypothetical protein
LKGLKSGSIKSIITLGAIGRIVGVGHPQLVKHHLERLLSCGFLLKDENGLKISKKGEVFLDFALEHPDVASTLKA